MRFAFRNIALLFVLTLCGLSALSQPGAWNPPFKQTLPANLFKDYGVCISYKTDSFVYFAVSQNATPNQMDIFEFDGDTIRLVLHDGSGSLSINSSDRLVKYDGKFYISTYVSENAGTSDTAGHFYKWDGTVWKPLINSIYFDKTGPGIISIVELNGDLYLGGGFDSINGMNLNHIVRFDGNTFSPVVYGGFTGTSHYGFLALSHDTVCVFGDGDYSAFNSSGWLWRNKKINFYFYENFILNGRLHFISLQTGNIWLLNKSTLSLSGMSVPSESSMGKRSGLVVNNGNLHSYLDSTYKVSGIDHARPNGLHVHNQKTQWNKIPSSTVSESGVYNFYSAIKLFSFKNKLYVWGHIDTLNAKGDTLRFLATFSSPIKKVKGRVYEDKDSNCKYTTNEKPLKGRIVEALPGPYYCSTDDSGRYSFDLPFASYQISLVQKNYWNANKCDTVFKLNIKDTLQLDTLNFGQWQQPLNDVAVSITGNTGYRARWGFDECYHLSVSNIGYQQKSTKLSLTFPNGLTNFSANPSPSSQTGNTAEWQLNSINSGETKEISFCLTVDTGNFQVAEKMIFTASITAPADDVSNKNNVDTLRQKVVSSLDPNDKQVYPFTSDSITILAPGITELEYTIHFENLGNDTAYKIVVLDTISVNLDVKQIEQTGISHAGKLDVLQCHPDFGRCVLRWTFNNIKLPHKPLGEGPDFTQNRGHVSYKITMVKGLLLGTSIFNHADIYFDFNQPVTTNTVWVKVDTPTITNGILQLVDGTEFSVFPNPFNDVLQIGFNTAGRHTITICDVTGRECMSHTVQGSGVTMLPVTELLPGIYFLKTSGMKQAVKVLKY